MKKTAFPLILLIGCGIATAQAAEYTIKLVTLANTNDEDYDGALVFEDYVESRSNGAIAVEVFAGGQLCGSNMECLLALKGGVMEVFQCALGGLVNWFPEIQVLDLPYVFPNDRVVEQVYGGPFLTELREAILEETGLRLMALSNTGGWRNFANTRREVRTPADLEGLKLRTINSPIQIELTKALGASPTPIPWPELYIALATGVVDGSKNGITDIVSMNFQEHIKYLTLDGHAYMTALWMMNNEAFLELPKDLRKVVVDGFEVLRDVTTAIPKRRRIEAVKKFLDAGGSIYTPTPEEKAQFVEAAAPVKTWYIDKYGTAWLEKLEAAIASAEAELQAVYERELQ